MSSTNKKNKLKNSYQVPGGLKEELRTGVKKMSFYTSSARQKLKEELEHDLLDIDEDTDNYPTNKDTR